jgi:hypothetical protein
MEVKWLNLYYKVMRTVETTKMFHSENGESLVSILVGLSIMSVVGFSAAHLTADAKKAEIFGDLTNSVNQIHLLSLQKSRNTTLLKSVLSSSLHEAGIDLGAGSQMSQCLSGNGTNCTNLNQNEFQNLTIWSESITISRQIISNKVEYRISCSSDAVCETIQLRITTEAASRGIRRSTDLRNSGALLGATQELSFSCVNADQQIVTGVDFKTKKALCQGIPVSTACNGKPLVDLDAGSDPSCADMAVIDCPQGLKTVGLIDSQGACL